MEGNAMAGRRAPRTTLYAEIRQSVPFDRPERTLAVALLRTTDVLRHSLERALAKWRVSPEQYNVLRILRGAGDAGHPTLEIGRRTIARSPNVTRLVDKLVARRLAARTRGETDRRLAMVRLTPRGREVLAELDAAVDGVLSRLRGPGASEVARIVRALDSVREDVAVNTVREELEKNR